MKKLGKTKILRFPDREVYFVKIETNTGETGWLLFEKDKSAILKADYAKKFKNTNRVYDNPIPYDQYRLRKPIPDNYATDLLSMYAAPEYAPGHEPLGNWLTI